MPCGNCRCTSPCEAYTAQADWELDNPEPMDELEDPEVSPRRPEPTDDEAPF